MKQLIYLISMIRSLGRWLGFAIAFLGVINATNAGCPDGAEKPCMINGKRGHQVCAGGGYGPCIPDEEESPPIRGKIHPMYYILWVIYAPPGTQGGGSTSSVTYGSGSTAVSTVSVSSSFKSENLISVTAEGGFLGSGGEAGGSFGTKASESDSHSVEITKSNTTTITMPGPSLDGIDHDHDEIWLWLNPTIDLSLTPTSVTWNFETNAQADIQKVYVGWLKDPSKMPRGLADRLETYGITKEYYPDLLRADPAASGPIAINPERFDPLPMTFPYNPPQNPGDSVSMVNTTIGHETTTSRSHISQSELTVGVSLELGIGFIELAKTKLKIEDKFTWTNTNTTAASTGASQSAGVTVGGPAYGYSGPTDIGVYYDLIYNTFFFAPVDERLQPLSLHGSVTSSSGKALVGKEVVVVANGVKYRTFTNTKGEYHIFGKISGPLQLQVSSVKKHLPQLPPDNKADIVLPIAKEESGREQ